MSINKTFHGYIETTKDALLLFEACERGILPRVSRRLQDKEKYLIQSGTIFCFDERESGIKRWTDGLVWSPSRILGNFLVYRELEDKKSMSRSCSTDATTALSTQDYLLDEEESFLRGDGRRSASFSSINNDSTYLLKKREKAIVGSLRNSYRFKRNGLIKKSISLIVDGVQQHLISYYHKDDVLFQRLNTPSNVPNLSSLEVSPGLKLRQNFRIPLLLSDDGSDDGNNYSSYQNNKSAKRKFSEFIQQTSSKSPSLITSPTETSSFHSSNSSLTPPDQIKNYSAPQAAPMTFKQEDTNLYPTSVTHIDSSATALIPTYQPLNMYSNDMFHTTINGNGTTSNINKSDYSHLTQKQSSQEQQQQSYQNTDTITKKTSSSYGTSFRSCSNHDMRYNTIFDQQNPHQHLFSSSSFHAINHASINQRIDPIANAFMLDIDTLLGTGWNEFELQL